MKRKTNYFIFSEKDLENAFAPYFAFLTSADKSGYAHRYAFKRSDGTNTNTACFFVDEGRSTDGTVKISVGEYDSSGKFCRFKSTRQIKNRLKRVLEPNKAEQTKEENKTMEDPNFYLFTAEALGAVFAPYLDKLVFNEDKQDGSIHLKAKGDEDKEIYRFFHITQGMSEDHNLKLRVFGTMGSGADYFLSPEDLENELKSAFGTELDKLKQILTEAKSNSDKHTALPVCATFTN